jgi:UDP-glucuronate 4-epimerase
MTRVLVTGGLGFIGSRLCATLLDEGFSVVCVDDLSGSYGERTGRPAAAPLAARGAQVVLGKATPAHVAEVDAVVHCAAIPGVRTARPRDTLMAANAELSERLAAAAAQRSARFVLVSSSSVYGNASVLPTPEHAPAAPLNAYAESKAAAELAVLARGGDPVIVRPFSVYGPGQRPDMAFARWIGALRCGMPVPLNASPGTARDFTYVDDVAAGMVAALRRGRTGEAYNLSGWRAVDLRHALDLVACGRDPRVSELSAPGAEARATHGCGRKAAVELGYAPRVGLAEGVRRQLAVASSGRLAA